MYWDYCTSIEENIVSIRDPVGIKIEKLTDILHKNTEMKVLKSANNVSLSGNVDGDICISLSIEAIFFVRTDVERPFSFYKNISSDHRHNLTIENSEKYLACNIFFVFYIQNNYTHIICIFYFL